MVVPVQRNRVDLPGVDPFAQLERLHSQLGSVLDTWGPMPELPTTGFVPRVDVQERDDAYVVEVEVPDVVDEDRVTAVLDEGVLRVTLPKSKSERGRLINVMRAG